MVARYSTYVLAQAVHIGKIQLSFPQSSSKEKKKNMDKNTQGISGCPKITNRLKYRCDGLDYKELA
jgi:hypothetical protein